jgi:hypothetical protein
MFCLSLEFKEQRTQILAPSHEEGRSGSGRTYHSHIKENQGGGGEGIVRAVHK